MSTNEFKDLTNFINSYGYGQNYFACDDDAETDPAKELNKELEHKNCKSWSSGKLVRWLKYMQKSNFDEEIVNSEPANFFKSPAYTARRIGNPQSRIAWSCGISKYARQLFQWRHFTNNKRKKVESRTKSVYEEIGDVCCCHRESLGLILGHRILVGDEQVHETMDEAVDILIDCKGTKRGFESFFSNEKWLSYFKTLRQPGWVLFSLKIKAKNAG